MAIKSFADCAFFNSTFYDLVIWVWVHWFVLSLYTFSLKELGKKMMTGSRWSPWNSLHSLYTNAQEKQVLNSTVSFSSSDSTREYNSFMITFYCFHWKCTYKCAMLCKKMQERSGSKTQNCKGGILHSPRWRWRTRGILGTLEPYGYLPIIIPLRMRFARNWSKIANRVKFFVSSSFKSSQNKCPKELPCVLLALGKML